MKKLLVTTALAAVMLVGACQQASDVASRNLSTAADNFEVLRRVVFFNGITDSYLLEITGYCSKGNDDKPTQVTIICRNSDNTLEKHFMGLSDNVSYLIEQLDGKNVSTLHTRVVFRPQSIIPDVDFQGDVEELLINRN